jgi:prepilin-type processing-associated H-X9-DG protein
MDRGIVTTRFALLIVAMMFVGSAAGFAAPQSGVEKLLTIAPDDLIFVAGTSGGAELAEPFKQTPLGKMWADPQTQAFFGQLRDTVLAQIRANGGFKDPNDVKFLADTLALVISRPRIAGAAPQPAGGDMPVYFFAMVSAGPAKDDIAARMKKFEKMVGAEGIQDLTIAGCKVRAIMKSGAPAFWWGLQGDNFVIAVNDPQGLALKHLADSHSSSSSCLAPVAASDDAFALYADFARIKSVFKLDQSQDPDLKKVSSVLTGLGLDKVTKYVLRAGFSGEQVVAEQFINAPEPRTGLLAAIKPVNLKAFDMVDPNSVSAATMNLDSGAIFDTIMNTIRTVDENTAREVADGMARFETKSQLKLRDGIIASLAGPITAYTAAPSSMDMMGAGNVVIIADLKDASKFQQNMAAMGNFITTEAKGALQISTQNVDGKTLNIWAVPQLAMVGLVPTWTVVDNKFVLGSSQQACKEAAARVASPDTGKSLSALPAFRTLTKNLPAGTTYFKYLDSRMYFRTLMSQAQRLWPMATMAATQNGIALPYVLPDLSKYENDLKPGAIYSWTDKDGIHSMARGSGIEEAISAVAGGAVGAAAIVPAMAKARQQSKNMVGAGKLKELGLALHMYADSHNDKFPAKLEDLVSDANFSRDLLRSKRKPADFKGPSFIYVAGLTVKSPAQSVLVFENPGYCGDGKLNVLFVDGHVQMMDKTSFREELKKTYDFLGQPVPEVKFGTKSASKKPADPNKPAAVPAPAKADKP